MLASTLQNVTTGMDNGFLTTADHYTLVLAANNCLPLEFCDTICLTYPDVTPHVTKGLIKLHLGPNARLN
jgi:hypothetical protein